MLLATDVVCKLKSSRGIRLLLAVHIKDPLTVGIRRRAEDVYSAALGKLIDRLMLIASRTDKH